MKPSERWKAINDKQSWKSLPRDYKSHYGKPLTAKHSAKTIHLNLTDKQFNWIQTFRRNYRSFYGSDDSVVESLLVNMINKPLEKYIDPTTNRWNRVHNTREAESHHTYVISEDGMATVFLTNFIRCRTSFRMLFRLSLTMSLLGCDDLRQELTVKVRLPR